MTITAFFGDQPTTLANSDVSEAADSSDIEAASVSALLNCQEGADVCRVNVLTVYVAQLAATEAADSAAIAAATVRTATLAATEASDGSAVIANITLPNLLTVPYGEPRFVVIVPGESFAEEAP